MKLKMDEKKMITKQKRIGLLGGSFNPAHEGHVAMSLFALARLKLDEVWWLVSPLNPLKTRDEMMPYAVRLTMARAIVARHKNIIVTDIEKRLGTRFTIDTLHALKAREPMKKFVWLMGEDNFKTISSWKSWQQIFLALPVAVFRRSEYSDSNVGGDAHAVFAKEQLPLALAEDLADTSPPVWVMLDNKVNPLSATQIRQRSKVASKSNPSNEGVLEMVVKKPAVKKPAVKKPAAKKAVAKKPAAKKVVKKAVAKKPAAKKVVKKAVAKKPAAKKVVKKAVAKKPADKKVLKKAVKKTVKK
ncbi:MAG: nicotinate-nucleotide adenylyltransferase [Bdellovibrionales bacterium]|jgi:nicotinate-nucleotide adenylyltransferase